MPLSIAPEPVELSPVEVLDSQIKRLSQVVDRAIDGDIDEHAGDLAKLIGAMARLIDARTKAEQTVTKVDLDRFVAGMTRSINAHVASPEERELLGRDWRRLALEVAG